MACPLAQRLCHHRRALGAGSRLLHPWRRRSVTLRESAQQRLGTRVVQSAPCPSPGEDLHESDPPMLGALYPTCSCAERITCMQYRAVRRDVETKYGNSPRSCSRTRKNYNHGHGLKRLGRGADGGLGPGEGVSARLLLVLRHVRVVQRRPLLREQHALRVPAEQHGARRQRVDRKLHASARISLSAYITRQRADSRCQSQTAWNWRTN